MTQRYPKLGHYRRLYAGGGERAHLRRRTLPQLHGSGDGHGKKDWRVSGSEIPPAAQVARAGDTRERKTEPNNRLQLDRGPRAALSECERLRLGRGG